MPRERRDRTVPCYVCGREFGSKSVGIHEPQCLKKWNLRNQQLPRGQRRPPPPPSPSPPQLQNGGSRQEQNEVAWQAAQANQAQCKNCKRTFAADRLAVHLRSCRPRTAVLRKGRPEGRPVIDITASPTGGPPLCISPRPSGDQRPRDMTVSRSATTTSCRSAGNSGRLETARRTTGSFNPFAAPQSRPSAPRRKPRFVVCYICGREFTTASLPIHEPQCLEKWQIENAKLPREHRRQMPKKPEVRPLAAGGCTGSSSYDIDAINAAARDAANANLKTCATCGRTFNADRILVHERICRRTGSVPKALGRQPSKLDRDGPASRTVVLGRRPAGQPEVGRGDGDPEPEPEVTPARPRTKPEVGRRGPVFCPICGRQFGSRSIAIHQPQCLKKWHLENDRLPAGMRRPAPDLAQLPAGGASGMNRAEVECANYEAAQRNLVPCGVCGRTFTPARVLTHQEACRKLARNSKTPAGAFGRPAGKNSGSQESEREAAPRPSLRSREQENRPKSPPRALTGGGTYRIAETATSGGGGDELAPCGNCRRTFLPERLAVHQRSCKPRHR